MLIIVVTILISLGSMYFAKSMFPTHASVLSVAFITIGVVPLLHIILSRETDDEVHCRKSAPTFFARHFNLIQLYLWVFVGIILSFSVVYVISPPAERTLLFSEQIGEFCAISGSDACTGNSPLSAISGKATAMAFDECKNPATSTVASCTGFILGSNSKVLFAVIGLSIIYGAGAIFIIAWNASILGVFFGEMFLMNEHVKSFGFLQSMLVGHGPPELFAYIFGALAGAILSAIISRGEFFTHNFYVLLTDVVFLAALAIFSVIYGAATEAVGMMGMTEVYFGMGFAYLLIIIVAVFIYGKKSRPNVFAY